MPIALVWASWVVIFWGVVVAKPFLVPLLLAALVAFLMAPVAAFLRRKNYPEWAAVTITSLILFLPVLVLAGLVIGEGRILVRDAPRLAASLVENLNKLAGSDIAAKWGVSEYLDVGALTENLREGAGEYFKVLLHGVGMVASGGAHLLIVLGFAVLMLASREALTRASLKVFADPTPFNASVKMIETFLAARLGIALGVAMVDYLILLISHSTYAILLACLLGTSTLIPIVGFVLAILPPIALGLASGHSPSAIALMVFFLYLVATTESHFVAPKILGKSLNLNLLATFVVLFAGELLWGVWGMVLSIPLAGILRIVLSETKRGKLWAGFIAEEKH